MKNGRGNSLQKFSFIVYLNLLHYKYLEFLRMMILPQKMNLYKRNFPVITMKAGGLPVV
ncbi:NBS-LRR resistance-like protein 4F [Staphylococcus caprae]|uniref:NBS-LRR resistance-like protein 4F n=1 Tax=Staphylococcus caprae TaxID=29380 RepID=A0ABM7FRW6_9STAP|nr:NBS-LRR resistance-like protein 4F [Staphylococcus caprae]BBD91177.1 NBS-LRR resistance-like protein 4F [Staphylococcus caprae]BBD93687.1 NBS-LRR resistance-like protein 4F [Staphylococcus caprae]